MRFISSSLIRSAALVGAVALASCASTDYHYSQLVGTRYYRAPIDTYPVTILSVDGKSTTLRPVLVDPGLRKVTVQGPSGAANPTGEQREIALDVRPCMRYYLVAVRPNRIVADFDVRVDYQEPVSGCTPPASS
jgi:hypothetical protein